MNFDINLVGRALRRKRKNCMYVRKKKVAHFNEKPNSLLSHHMAGLPQWINYGPMSIDSNCRQRKHGDIHAERLHKRTEAAHKIRQIPALQQRGLKLKKTKELNTQVKFTLLHTMLLLLRLAATDTLG